MAPSLTVEDPHAPRLSTLVTVPRVVSRGPGILVVREGDASGPRLGYAALSAGDNADVSVPLDRPLEDGEALMAVLHVDGGEVGVFERPGVDAPATHQGRLVTAPFEVRVAEGTPAVRIQLAREGSLSWIIDSTTPASFAEEIIGPGVRNQSLTLRMGWRYEVVNASVEAHPFELIISGGFPVADVPLLSQRDDGSLEHRDSIDWQEVDGAVRFTASPTLSAIANGYRCAAHPGAMRGEVVFE